MKQQQIAMGIVTRLRRLRITFRSVQLVKIGKLRVIEHLFDVCVEK